MEASNRFFLAKQRARNFLFPFPIKVTEDNTVRIIWPPTLCGRNLDERTGLALTKAPRPDKTSLALSSSCGSDGWKLCDSMISVGSTLSGSGKGDGSSILVKRKTVPLAVRVLSCGVKVSPMDPFYQSRESIFFERNSSGIEQALLALQQNQRKACLRSTQAVQTERRSDQNGLGSESPMNPLPLS